MLHFNTPEKSKERQRTKPLTLAQEERVVEILNMRLLAGYQLTKVEERLLQRFLNHYQNLNHHKATTVGLWATDTRPKVWDKNNAPFQIKF